MSDLSAGPAAAGSANTGTVRPRVPNILLEAGVVIGWSSGFRRGNPRRQHGMHFSVLLWRFAVVAVVLSPRLWPIIRKPPGSRWLARHGVIGFVGMFCCHALGIKAIAVTAPPVTML